MSNHIEIIAGFDGMRLGWALIHFLWQGLAVALVLEIALGMAGRQNASLRYVLCVLALAAMPMCLLDTYLALGRESHTMASQPGVVKTVVMSPASTSGARAGFTFLPVVHSIADFTSREILFLEINRCLPVMVTCWLGGVVLLGMRKAGGFVVLGRWRRRGITTPDDAMCELCRRACDRIGVDPRRVYLGISSLVQVPMTMGWVRPIILFPAALLSGLSTEEIELLLAHELAHIRRCDYLVNVVQTVVETLFFYHPVTWWVSRRIRQERENSCDDIVATRSSEVLAYANVLVRLESLRPSDAPWVTAANGGNLLQRIQRLADEPAPAPGRGLSILFALISILGVIAAVSVLQAQTPPSDTSSSTNSNAAAESTLSTNADAGTNSTSTPSTNSDAGTNSTSAPSPDTAPTSTNAAAAVASPSSQTIYYQDNFSRKGELDGSSPDTKNTGKSTWTVSTGPGTYSANGSTVSDSSAAYDAAYLPVNGTSGVTLDGKQNFTVSAAIVPDASGHWMGISLNTAPITAGHNIFDSGMAQLTVAGSYADAYNQGTNLNHDTSDYSGGKPTVVSITYHAISGTLTYSVGDKIIATLPKVTADQIAGLTAIAMGNGSEGPTGTIGQFTLSVGGAD